VGAKVAKETLTSKVDSIVTTAMKQDEELIKSAVMDRMSKKPYPKTFIFAMGRCFWIDSQDRNTDYSEGAKVPRRGVLTQPVNSSWSPSDLWVGGSTEKMVN
jgi:hypothetical protein